MSIGPSHLELKFATIQSRHPELVSGSIVPQAMTPNGEEWMLKQVQHDGHDTTNFSSTILAQRPPQPHHPPDHPGAARRRVLDSRPRRVVAADRKPPPGTRDALDPQRAVAPHDDAAPPSGHPPVAGTDHHPLSLGARRPPPFVIGRAAGRE